MTRNTPHSGAASNLYINSTTAQVTPVPNATQPYWRSELHPLDSFRSTASLPRECDVAIIGAGMAGVSLAYHLIRNRPDHEQDLSIVLLDARQVCSGATGRNGGHVKCKTAGLLSLKKHAGVNAAEQFDAFTNNVIYGIKDVVEKENLECEFELRRSFDVFLDAEEGAEVVRGFKQSIACGEHWTRDRSIVPETHLEQVTSIRHVKAAISTPACSLWPYKFVTQLLDRIIPHLNLQTNTPVTAVLEEDNFQVLKTPRGDIRAKKVIFASNGYTGGISSSYASKIIPVRIAASHLTPNKPVSPHLSCTYNIAYAPSFVDYLNPRPDGSIVVGGGKKHYSAQKDIWYNVWDDSKLLPNVDVHFSDLMQRHFSGWQDSGSKLESLWTGIIGYTADEQPHIGEVPNQEGKQYILAGFNGGGMAIIFEAARGLARMVHEGVSFEDTGMPFMFKTSSERLKANPGEGQPD